MSCRKLGPARPGGPRFERDLFGILIFRLKTENVQRGSGDSLSTRQTRSPVFPFPGSFPVSGGCPKPRSVKLGHLGCTRVGRRGAEQEVPSNAGVKKNPSGKEHEVQPAPISPRHTGGHGRGKRSSFWWSPFKAPCLVERSHDRKTWDRAHRGL